MTTIYKLASAFWILIFNFNFQDKNILSCLEVKIFTLKYHDKINTDKFLNSIPENGYPCDCPELSEPKWRRDGWWGPLCKGSVHKRKFKQSLPLTLFHLTAERTSFGLKKSSGPLPVACLKELRLCSLLNKKFSVTWLFLPRSAIGPHLSNNFLTFSFSIFFSFFVFILFARVYGFLLKKGLLLRHPYATYDIPSSIRVMFYLCENVYTLWVAI